MPTVDDLVISLTIKETGRLGNLQKQLEALVGKKGDKILQIGQVPFELIRDVDYIRRRMDYLVPIVSPASTDIKALKIQASSTILQLQTFKDEITGFLTGLPKEHLAKLYEAFNVKEGDYKLLTEKMDKLLEEFEGELDDIRTDRTKDYEASKRFNDKLINTIRSIRQKGGERLVAITDLLKFIPEAQERWERIMEASEVGVEGQFQIYKIKDEVISSNNKIKKWLDENSEDYEDLKKFFEGAGEDVTVPFLKALKQLGYTDKIKDILTTSKAIEEDTKLQNLVKAMVFSLAKFSETDERELDLYLPEGVKRFIQETVKPLGKKSIAESGVRRLDLMLFEATKLAKIFPEAKDIIIKATEEIGIVPAELKGVMKGGDRITKQLEIYKKIFGEYLIVIARMIKPKGKKLLGRLGITGVTKMFLREIEEQYKLSREPPTRKEIKESIEKLTETIEKEKKAQFIEDFRREHKMGEGLPSKEIEKAIKMVKDAYKKQFGPSYPEKSVIIMEKMIEKSRETGFDYFKLMDYFGDILTSLKEEPKTIMEVREKAIEELKELPKSEILRNFMQELKAEISNKDIWSQVKELFKLLKMDYSKTEQIINILKGFMAGKSTEIPQKKLKKDF